MNSLVINFCNLVLLVGDPEVERDLADRLARALGEPDGSARELIGALVPFASMDSFPRRLPRW
jgi:hypothetical protein